MHRENKEPTCVWTEIFFILLVLVEVIVRGPHTGAIRVNLSDVRLELVHFTQQLSFLLSIKPYNLLKLRIQQRRESVVRRVPTARTTSQPVYFAEKGRAFVCRSFEVVYPSINAGVLLLQGIDVLLERRVPRERDIGSE